MKFEINSGIIINKPLLLKAVGAKHYCAAESYDIQTAMLSSNQ
jgi:hypothetical protein